LRTTRVHEQAKEKIIGGENMQEKIDQFSHEKQEENTSHHEHEHEHQEAVHHHVESTHQKEEEEQHDSQQYNISLSFLLNFSKRTQKIYPQKRCQY